MYGEKFAGNTSSNRPYLDVARAAPGAPTGRVKVEVSPGLPETNTNPNTARKRRGENRKGRRGTMWGGPKPNQTSASNFERRA